MSAIVTDNSSSQRATLDTQLTRFSVSLMVAGIITLGFYPVASYAQSSQSPRGITIVDKGVAETDRSRWEQSVLDAGFAPVPRGELDAALLMSNLKGKELTPTQIEELRTGLNADIAVLVSVRTFGPRHFAVRVSLYGASGVENKFGKVSRTDLATEGSRLVSEILEAHKLVAYFPRVVFEPKKAEAPTSVAAQMASTPESSTVSSSKKTTALVANRPFERGALGYKADGFFGMPMGDFGDAASFGMGALAALTYDYQPKIQLSLRAGFIYYAAEAEDTTLLAMPMWLGVRYFLKESRDSIFAHAEVGFSDYYASTMTTTDTQFQLSYNLLAGKDLKSVSVEGGLYMSKLDGLGTVTMLGGTVGRAF